MAIVSMIDEKRAEAVLIVDGDVFEITGFEFSSMKGQGDDGAEKNMEWVIFTTPDGLKKTTGKVIIESFKQHADHYNRELAEKGTLGLVRVDEIKAQKGNGKYFILVNAEQPEKTE